MTDEQRRKLITKLVGIDITAEDAREGLYAAAVLADKAAKEIEQLVKERNEALEELRLWKLQG